MGKNEKFENLNFEEAMKKLEEISNKLEAGEISLEESIDLFTDGMKLSKMCSKKLELAEKKISMLVKDDSGTLNEVEFGD